MSKIIITDIIRNRIKQERRRIDKNSVDLSMELKGSKSYVSLIESGRIAKINLQDLKKIFNILLGLEGIELEEYINNLINESIDNDEEDEDTTNDNDEEFKVAEYELDINKNDYQKLLNDIQKGFMIIFNKTSNKEYVISNILKFNKNMHFDLGFMTALVGIPFYALKNASFEEKQKLLNDIAELLQKNIERNNKKDDSSENLN